ncbi:MAG: hypothetical protein LC658_14495 [Bacteroidales bacterium]|nr:hypothetical protein [Bacteroidales bacterium]
MKKTNLTIAILIMTFGSSIAQTSEKTANEIVSFLAGKWHNFSYFVVEDEPVQQQDYKETMVIKNDSTLTITAHEYKDGKDLTRDMTLLIGEDKITMRQGDFSATGSREGNAYYLKGNSGGKEYRFRLYTLGDKYIFHSEVWANGKMEMMNMSYLVRE